MTRALLFDAPGPPGPQGKQGPAGTPGKDGFAYEVVIPAALGNSVADATGVIQAALDSGAGVIRVPDGTFKITGPLYVRKGPVKFCGTHDQTAILKWSGTTSVGILIEAPNDTVAHTTIENLFLDGNGFVRDMVVGHSAFLTVHHNYIQNGTRFGILIESGNASGVWGTTNLLGTTYINSDAPNISRNTMWENASYAVAQTAVNNYVQPAIYSNVSVTVTSTANIVAGMVCATIATASLGAGTPANIYTVESVDGPTSLTLKWLANTNAPQQASATVTSASLQFGGNICLHGADSQAGYIGNNFVYNSVVDFCEASLGGNTWEANYSEGRTVLGYFLGDSASASTWVCCNGEPITLLAAPLGYSGVVVGGDLSRNLSLIPAAQSYGLNVFGHECQIVCKQTGTDTATYYTMLPGCNAVSSGNAALDFGRTLSGTTTGWNVVYNKSSNFWFGQAVWFFWHHTGLVFDGDPNAGVIGFSESGQTDFGAPALLVGAAQGNTQRHWAYKQTGLALAAGQNTVYLNGGVGSDSGSATFADLGTAYWPSSLPNVRAHLEFDTVAHMVSAGACSVDGVVIISKGGATNNLAAGVHVTSSCTATLVWEFDLYIPATRDGR